MRPGRRVLIELRHFSRVIRRSPTSAAVAVLTLALTLGVGTALFALVDAVVLTPPPFVEPESLVLIGEVPIESMSASPRPVSWTTFEGWREYRHIVTQIEGFDPTNMTLTGRGPAERVSGAAVTPGFFSLLGVSPMLGRTWSEERGASDVAVVSQGFWRVRLGADPNVLGDRIVLGGRSYTVVAVLPKRFTFGQTDIWIPLPRSSRDGRPSVRVLGRLAPGTAANRASLALDEVSSRSTPPARAVALPLAGVIAGTLGTLVPLLLLGASVAISLAVINLTGLLVVRAIERHREFAIRRALGASALQLSKQLLIETHVLVALGAIGGTLVALWITPLVGRLAVEQFGSVAASGLGVNWRSIAALGLTVWACALLCGLTVAARALRAKGGDLLSRSASAGPRELALRRILVAAEITLAFVLLASLAVVGRSLQRTFAINPGFNAAHVLTASVSVPPVRYPNPQRVAEFYENIDQAVSNRLGRENVAIVDELPLTGDSGRSLVGEYEGRADRESVVRVAGTNYFNVMRIPIVDGRGFEGHDDPSAPLRVVISQSLSRELFGDPRSAGRRIWVAALGQMAEVIGVAGDVKHRALDERPLSTIYLSAWQQPSRSSHLVVRSVRGTPDILSILRTEVERLDRELPVYAVRSMDDVVQTSSGMPTRRLMAACFLAFAALAVVVAGLGIFGVVTHDVARRRFEFAVRVALGATAAQLRGSIAGSAAVTLAAGLLPGVLLAAAASRMLRSVLVDIDVIDPVAFAAVTAVLCSVASIAIVGPARRVTRTDPALVLRGE
jgi:putative ABC transport system permease protein